MFDRRLLSNFDWLLFFLVLGLCLVGVAGIYSASHGYAQQSQFWVRQLVWIGLGLGAGFVVLLFDFRTIGNMAYYLHGGMVFLLLVLLLFDGPGGGANRWFMIAGVAVQPSEFVKLTLVLAVAHYFRDSRRVNNLGLRGILWPLAILGAPFFLIVQQPDLGTALLLILIFIPMVFLAGIKPRIVGLLILGGVLAVAALVGSFHMGFYQVDGKVLAQMKREGVSREVMAGLQRVKGQTFHRRAALREGVAGKGKRLDERTFEQIREKSFRPYISALLRPYQQKRLVTFVDPDRDPLGAGYHVIQSRVAVGSGGLWGKGFRQSTQGSLNFLPARHTDFVFSIFAEEWGFFGATALLVVYLLVILRSLGIMLQTHDRYSSFLIMGVVAIITFQVLINMGMAVGMLPVVGVPLPFFSYGGSSMLMLMVGLGLILNIRMRRFLWS